MTDRKTIIMMLAAVMAVACGQKKAESFKALPFPDKQIPGMITGRSDRADYLAEHFWDLFADPERTYPCDSLLVSGVKAEDVEQKFANWISILDMVAPSVQEKAVARLYGKALACEVKDTSSNVFETFTGLAERYLYDPNSPLRNEEYYLHFASRMAGYEGFPDELKTKYAYHAEMCSMNRIGAKAADFRFSDHRGKVQTLYEINSPMTLLFFSNPGCGACMDIVNMLKNEPKISDMISTGVLAVVNIYIDEDIEEWMDYMPVYPKEWYNGFDPDMTIRTDNLYCVRAIPSLYLLDEEKRVIMKDAPEDKVMSRLLSL